MIGYVRDHIAGLLEAVGIGEQYITLTDPPQKKMGDVAFPVFQYAKELKKNPIEVANGLAEKFNQETEDTLVERAEAFGPYVNFFLNDRELASVVLNLGERVRPRVADSQGTIMIEFICANTHKAFHIGHLRNAILGESLVRLHEYAGYRVIRTTYGGDVGMHIAKCLWGIEHWQDDGYDAAKKNVLVSERMKFIGKAYAYGATQFEKDEKAQEEIKRYNEMIYQKDPAIADVYETTRSWSLENLERIYQLLDIRFDRYYFESEVFDRAIEIVSEGLANGIFEKSDGAVIFRGSAHDLHDRVFLNRAGLPTYEAKDLALAEKQFDEFHPDAIYHVIGPEQSEYLKVLFKTLEFTLPESKGKEFHIPYGWVDLKGVKMSSRTGDVVTAEDLIAEVKMSIREHMDSSEAKVKVSPEEKERIIENVSMGAVKYAFLKTGRVNNITFDVQESISTSGDSGPYLLYIVARFKSILAKNTSDIRVSSVTVPDVLNPFERAVIMKLGEFEGVVREAIEAKDPSKIAHYQFELSQVANQFYHECPVLDSEEMVRRFRLTLIETVVRTMEHGFDLLGITTVENM